MYFLPCGSRLHYPLTLSTPSPNRGAVTFSTTLPIKLRSAGHSSRGTTPVPSIASVLCGVPLDLASEVFRIAPGVQPGGLTLALRDRGAPFRWIQVPNVLREEPEVAVEILSAIFAFAVDGFVQIFDDLGARRFCFLEVRIHVIDEDSEALGAGAELGGSSSSLAHSLQHDPRVAEVQPCTADRGRVAVGVVFDGAEGVGQPSYGVGYVL
jgi:hypothetical protein